MTKRLHFPFSLSCIGEGNGNPLQCSGLENPRDGGAWWAAVYGVAESQIRLKRLNSSSRANLPLKVELILLIPSKLDCFVEENMSEISLIFSFSLTKPSRQTIHLCGK